MALYDVLRVIADGYQMHMLAYYAYELATMFHAYYSQHKIIDRENVSQTKGRLALVRLVKEALGVCLELLGVDKPERM